MGSHPVAGSPLKRGIQPKRDQHVHLVFCQNDASRKHLRQRISTSGSAGGEGPAGGSGCGGSGCNLDEDFKVRNLKI
jgi:hypothetical protein